MQRQTQSRGKDRDGGRISQESGGTEKEKSRQKHKAEGHNKDRKVTRRHRQGGKNRDGETQTNRNRIRQEGG